MEWQPGRRSSRILVTALRHILMWLYKILRSISVSPLIYVLMISSYNFGELVSCLRFHMPPILVKCPLYNGGALLLASTMVVGFGGVDVSFWDGENLELLVWSIIDVMVTVKTLRSSVIFVSFSSVLMFSHKSLACWLQLWIGRWVTFHQNCYSYCYPLLKFWSLGYEEWCYMAQMSINEQINWRNQCVKHVIRVEEVWEIGDRV